MNSRSSGTNSNSPVNSELHYVLPLDIEQISNYQNILSTFQLTEDAKNKLIGNGFVAIRHPIEQWTMRADYPGVFMYQSDGDNLNGIWEHIASGMYGEIIVHAPNEKQAKEFEMVFSELYNSADSGLFKGTSGKIGSFSLDKFIANRPDLILTNGMAYKYIPYFGGQTKLLINENAEEFKVKPGELTRWYVVNAGPRNYLAFNFAGGLINNNSITSQNHTGWLESKIYETAIAPGSGASIEVVFPEEGTYLGNDHDIGHLLIGGAIVVLATNNSSIEH